VENEPLLFAWGAVFFKSSKSNCFAILLAISTKPSRESIVTEHYKVLKTPLKLLNSMNSTISSCVEGNASQLAAVQQGCPR
jgi:hypothetical protein